MTALVQIDRRCRAAWPSLPAALPVGATFATDDAQVLRVLGDGTVAVVVQGGAPWGRSAASDPAAGRPRRTT